MADTIAKLIFQADTKALKEANKLLKNITTSAKGAEKAAAKKVVTDKKANDEVKKNTKETNKNTDAKKNNNKQTQAATKGNQKLSKAFQNAANATATLTGPLNGVSGRLSFIATGLGRVGVAGVATGAAFAGLGFAVSSSIREFAEFESQVLRLEAILQATGNTVGLTSQELQDLATEIGDATLAAAGDIRSASAILLSFGKLTDEQFSDTLRLTQDFAEVMGVTAASGAKTLGKALTDPVNSLDSLSRAGVKFTESEKDIIQTLIVANRELDAQRFIIDKLQGKIGGAGAAAGQGLAGAFDGLTEEVNKLKQAFAEESGIASFFANRARDLTKIAKATRLSIEAESGTTAQSSFTQFLQRQAVAFKNDITRFTNYFSRPSARKPLQTMGQSVTTSDAASESVIEAATSGVTTFRQDQEAQQQAPATTGPTIAQRQSLIQAQEFNIQLLDLQKQQSDHEAALFEEARELRFRTAAEAAQLEFELEVSQNEAKREQLLAERDFRIQLAEERYEQEQQMELQHRAKLGDIEAKGQLARANFEKKTTAAQTKQVIGQLSQRLSAAASMNKAMFRISQMAAIAETVVNTREAMQLARSSYPPPVGAIMAGVELAAGVANLAAIKGQKFGGGGSVGGSAGGVSGSSAAASAPIQPAANDEAVEAPSVINVTVDGTIDPSGARRIIEAINEATEDGLEINALVGT
jgi:hypothetical protein